MQLTLFDEHYQPRFQAYLDHMNATHKSEVKMHDYIVWISGLAEDFKRLHGIHTLHGRQDEFTDYVRRQTNDLRGRNQAAQQTTGREK